jgi:hypothetical protein
LKKVKGSNYAQIAWDYVNQTAFGDFKKSYITLKSWYTHPDRLPFAHKTLLLPILVEGLNEALTAQIADSLKLKEASEEMLTEYKTLYPNNNEI